MSRRESERLHGFVVESNRIEGIDRPPMQSEMDAHAAFLALRTITVDALAGFVHAVAGASLRCYEGMNVRVGPHLPPPGGPAITVQLRAILADANDGVDPYEVHVAYETLHPFNDGNGRSGRALWAWQMLRDGRDPFALPFLHRWYYDSLDAERRAHA